MRFCTDKANFGVTLSNQEKRFIIDNEPCRPLGPFPKDINNRSFSSFYYSELSKSGIKTERWWLCYSMKLNECYCQPCWLFCKLQKPDQFVRGFSDWNHLNRIIKRHEGNDEHNKCCAIFDKWKNNKTIDKAQESLLRQEINKWRQILERIIDVTLTLATTNMPFRGTNENLDSSNPGVFLSIIKLLSKYDPVLKNLLDSRSKMSTTYLSPQIQNEIIDILGKAVKDEIKKSIESAPFFSIIIDTTQDISKTDQLSLIFRYVSFEYDQNKKPVPVDIVIKESFLGFIPIENQTSENLTNEIINAVNKISNLRKLRGQGYDGAANMSGMYSGVQARILKVAKNAPFVHCAAHNLNLVLNDSVSNIEKIRNFFDFVQNLYVFFAHSIKRWALLESCKGESKLKLKKLSTTRWSSRNDAIKALRFRYLDVLKALSKIILTSNNKAEIDDSKGFKNTLEDFETVFLIILQSRILNSIDTVSKLLQNEQQDIQKSSKLLKNVSNDICKLRNEFLDIKKEADITARKWGIIPEFCQKRIRKRKRFFDEVANDFVFETAEDIFRVEVFYKTLDIIISQLQSRTISLHQIATNFNILDTEVLLNSTDTVIYQMAENIRKIYEGDISDRLPYQLLAFQKCFSDELKNIKSVKNLLKFIMVDNYSSSSSFTEIITLCFLYLTIPVTVASAERSFSKLKLIRTYLRNSMSQNRLSSLAMLSIENTVARSIDLQGIITRFAAAKSRKVAF